MLDTLCLTGEVGWARLSASAREATQMVGATPIALFLREHARQLGGAEEPARRDAGDDTRRHSATRPRACSTRCARAARPSSPI